MPSMILLTQNEAIGLLREIHGIIGADCQTTLGNTGGPPYIRVSGENAFPLSDLIAWDYRRMGVGIPARA